MAKNPPEDPRLRGIPGGRSSRVSLRPSAQQGRQPYSEYLVPAQDHHGHSARADVRIPPTMAEDVERLVTKGPFPFKTKADLYRWAIWRGLTTLQEDSNNTTNISVVTKGVVSKYKAEKTNLDYREVLDGLFQTVQALLAQGMNDNAKRLIRETLKDVQQMDDPAWRDRYTRDLTERFGFLLEKK